MSLVTFWRDLGSKEEFRPGDRILVKSTDYGWVKWKTLASGDKEIGRSGDEVPGQRIIGSGHNPSDLEKMIAGRKIDETF